MGTSITLTTLAPDRTKPASLPSRTAIFSSGIKAIKTLPLLLDETKLLSGTEARFRGAEAVLVWGRKPSAARATKFAKSRGLPVLQIEDGFLRSVELGGDAPPLSIIVDAQGIYYDASSASDLESLISAGCSQDEHSRAKLLRSTWCSARLSKYNHSRTAGIPEGKVLVVDQTYGDESIAYGGANDRTAFAQMLEAALDEHPRQRLLLKIHPEVLSGRKRGHFEGLSAGQAGRIDVCAVDVHPSCFLEQVHSVYTVTSQLGFEALLWNKPVRCFGMPFYGGWGLTEDALAAPSRRRPVVLDDLVHAALVQYPRYIDPETGRRCEVERLMEFMALQRRMRERFPPLIHAFRFSRWKKPLVRAYFGGSAVRFVSAAVHLPQDGCIAVWGQRHLPKGSSRQKIVRLEDGFLRSVGLGADLVTPISWAMDSVGIYYVAAQPSQLERLCAEEEFPYPLVERARMLRQRIVAERVTKYNIGIGEWRRPAISSRVLLVIGQVEADASIAFGAADVRTNIDLLREARASKPDAYIVYKPHPDVVARLRRAGTGEDTAEDWCDEIVADVAIETLLEQVDEVHVLTSLSGFEALLRGRQVVVYGQPFYSGWGLTEDRFPLERRTRRLTLDELVAATLILYPAYVSRSSGAFTTPERALDELVAWRSDGASRPPAWRRLWRSAMRAVLRLRTLDY